MFQHCVFLIWWHTSHPKCPEVVLFSRSHRMAPKPLGASSFNAIALSQISCDSFHGVMDKVPAIPRCGWRSYSKEVLAKRCKCLPGSHFGKSCRIKSKKSGMQVTHTSLFCWAPQCNDQPSLLFSLLGRGQKKQTWIHILKMRNIFWYQGQWLLSIWRIKVISYLHKPCTNSLWLKHLADKKKSLTWESSLRQDVVTSNRPRENWCWAFPSHCQA